MAASTEPLNLRTIPYAELQGEVLVGAGGFGKVFKARHAELGTVAIKKLLTTLVDEVYEEKLHREAKTQSKLKHDNIALVHGVLWEPGQYGIVMEHVEHDALDIFLQRYKAGLQLPWKLAALGDVVMGMTYLHSRHVIHRDLKTQNLLVSADLRIKICDFGLAEWRTYSRTHTSYRSAAGTLTHIAPEHLLNLNHKATEKTDVYSFAIVIWEVLTEELPFSDVVNDNLLVSHIIDGARPDVRKIPADVESKADWLIEQMEYCWSAECAQRPTFKEVKAVHESNMVHNKPIVDQARIQMGVFIKSRMPQTQPKELLLGTPDAGQRSTHTGQDRGQNMAAYDDDSLDSTLVSEDGDTLNSLQETSTNLGYPTKRSTKTDPLATDYTNLGPVRGDPPPSVHLADDPPDEDAYPSDDDSSAYSSRQSGFPSHRAQPHAGGATGQPPAWGATGPPPDGAAAGSASGNADQSAKPKEKSTTTVHTISGNGQTTNIHTDTFAGTAASSRTESTSVHNVANMANVQIGNSNVMNISDGVRKTGASKAGKGSANTTNKSAKPTDKKKKIIVPSRELTEADMDFVATHIGVKWEHLGRKLGFSQGELDIIKSNHNIAGLHQQIFRMVYQWNEKEDTKATLKNLAKALCDVNLVEVALKIEEREKTLTKK